MIDAELGGTPQYLTSGDYSHTGPQWSRDGKTIYFSAIRKPEAEYLNGDSVRYIPWMWKPWSGTLTRRKGPDRGQLVSPDGKWVSYTGYDDRNFTSHLSSLYLMNAAGGQKNVAGDLPNSPATIIWAADSSGVYYMMAEKGSAICILSPSGGKSRRSRRELIIFRVYRCSNGQAATTLGDFYNPGSLVTFDLKAPADMEQMVDVNSDVLARSDWVRWRKCGSSLRTDWICRGG